MRNLYCFVLMLALVLAAKDSVAQLTFTSVASGLSVPMEIVSPPNASGRMFIVERGGTVKIFSGGVVQPGNFLDISANVSTVGERGFLSMAFHPNYAANRFFFVLYVVANGDLTLARYQTSLSDSNVADVGSGVVLLSIPHPTYDNHNGGKIAFGTDGNLYWSTGDGGGGNDPLNNAQNGASLLGKMLRLDVDNFTTPPYYTIPIDNPFVTDPAVADEIWNLGLRNPFRWSFDRLNGDFWIADVGQGAWEEVNHSPLATSSGLNYGWRCREGAHDHITGGCAPGGYTDPMFEYSHALGSSITGGYVYRGTLSPTLYGKYICADFVSGTAFVVTPGATAPYASVTSNPGVSNITGFGEDQNGELFAVSIGGQLFSVTEDVTPLPLKLLQFSAASSNNSVRLTWNTSKEEGMDKFVVERSADGQNWKVMTTVKATNSSSGIPYEAYDKHPYPGTNYYRLKLVETNGNFTYSRTERVYLEQISGTLLYPTPADNSLYLELKNDAPLIRSTILNTLGQQVLQIPTIGAVRGREIDISSLQPGLYYLDIQATNGQPERLKFVKK